ncbi:hypothetical protein [Chromobacterium phragmitis]|uniref:ApeI dehydratase-like domain-containing protein n=1 Tax=Chromobacterium phragmitis TaxID=2202141 RepID=A0A344ULU2_9NEIS|nr:hypothetical protein [Chromobacterium phragmitis]AXE36240.1 hypothetical protein DK843_19235 [Chromobacterium phragmitis]
MTLEATFDPGLGIFRHHFEHYPIVPGVMLVDHYVAHVAATWPDGHIAHLHDIRFQHFLRPGQAIKFTSNSEGDVRISCGELFNGTFLLKDGPSSVLSQPAVLPNGPGQSIRIDVLREPDYWFLPNYIEIAAERGWATCQIDLAALLRRHAYLGEVPRWQLLVLVECAGNLALALQHLVDPGDVRAHYVFARFGQIDYRMDCAQWASLQTVVTHVKRFGTLLVWEAVIGDSSSTQIVVRGAVSHRGKAL